MMMVCRMLLMDRVMIDEDIRRTKRSVAVMMMTRTVKVTTIDVCVMMTMRTVKMETIGVCVTMTAVMVTVTAVVDACVPTTTMTMMCCGG